MYYSYERVSTESQDLSRQEKAIREYCIEKGIDLAQRFSDKITGKIFKRDSYIEMKNLAKKGDTIIIKELDRFGRDWDKIKDEWKHFMDNEINIIVVDMPLLSETIIDKNGEVDLSMKLIKNIVFETLCYSAEYEKRKNNKRTSEALQAKKEQGVVLGRPKNEKKHKQILQLHKEGKNKTEIAFLCDTSRARVNQILKQYNAM